jgi:hypothetical protein
VISLCRFLEDVWQLLCSVASEVLAKPALERAFVRVAKNVPIETGRLLERIFACELSMLGRNGVCPMYNWISASWKGKDQLIPDPLVLGQPFACEAKIMEITWTLHQVYCVADFPKNKGKQLVDVGFPMVLMNDDGTKTSVRMMCELKKGCEKSELWRLC